MALAHTVLVLISIITHGAAHCANWQTNSAFCTNTNWPLTTRQAYCPTYCTNLGCPTTTTTTTATDGNTNCAKWAANPTTPFCVNTLTAAQKTLFCAQTCTFEITPNADCALYTLTGTTFARRTPSNRTATPGTAVASGAVAGTTTLSRVFANTGCTVKLFTDAAPADTATGELESHVGTATTKFFTVTAANNGALSYTCVCA